VNLLVLRRLAPLALATLLALSLVACTNNDAGPPPSDAATAPPTSTVALSPTATYPPISTDPPAPGPWEVGEPIPLTLEPYSAATLTEVTADTVLPPRDDLDRDGGSFLWERATDRLLFIEGVRHLHLAPELLDERPLAIGYSDWAETDVRSLIVRLDPFEVVKLPILFNIVGDSNERWVDATIVRVSTRETQSYGERTMFQGEYTLDLETATLAFVRERRSGTSSTIEVERTWWTGSDSAVSMLVHNGRRTLNHGDGGLGREIAGHIERWSLSPDESKLLMIANRSQLVVYDFEAERRWILGRPAEYGSAVWSPDGRYIAATVSDPFENTHRTLVFDSEALDAVESPDWGAAAADGLANPPVEGYWTWLWRDSRELFVQRGSTLSVLDVESGELTLLLSDRQGYDQLAWDANTSTIAHSRVTGVPVSILDLDEGSAWFDIPLLAASPHVGLFDMNWGAEGAWLALNTAGGRS
jgi:hypothetical protein